MGLTKIINILKNDSFKDVLDALKKTEAEEIIFVLPKNSKLAQKEQHFASLASEAEEGGKQITIMTTDHQIGDLAQKYGFRFLAQTVKAKKAPARVVAKDENEEEEFESKVADEDKPEEEEEKVLAELTAARTKTTSNPDAKGSGPRPKHRGKADKLESFWRGFNLDLIKKSRGHKKLNLVLISSAIIILLLALFTLWSKAQIIIRPQKQKIGFEIALSVSANTSQINTATNQIPGQFLAFRSDVSKDFSSTGEEELVRKARGEIIIYNNFSSDPQGLVATTRFESSKGLIFRIPRSVVVPGAKMVSGKLTPGSITVEVLADKAGQEYNINADRFTIPGFASSPKFEGFYGESTKPMVGGMIGLSKVVTEKDFNSAKDVVTKEALDKSLENLKNKKGDLEIVEPVTNEIIVLKSTAEIDDSAEGFAIAATAEAKTIGFSKDDLFKLVEASINKNGNWILLKEGLMIDYKNARFDFEKNTLNFTTTVNGEAAARIDEEKVINGLLGLKQNDIESYLLGFKEIESARLVLSPFWVKNIPKKKQDVEIKIVY